jgi:septal ring factor EnvC (AmiA/AmiB activator)
MSNNNSTGDHNVLPAGAAAPAAVLTFQEQMAFLLLDASAVEGRMIQQWIDTHGQVVALNHQMMAQMVAQMAQMVAQNEQAEAEIEQLRNLLEKNRSEQQRLTVWLGKRRAEEAAESDEYSPSKKKQNRGGWFTLFSSE